MILNKEAFSIELSQKCLQLEREELQSVATVPEELYVQLMLCYLYRNDLCNAKFLWKRIPQPIKVQSGTLEGLWNIGRALWRKDAVAVHIALQGIAWPVEIQEIIGKIQESFRFSTLELISRSYESLPFADFANSLGLSPIDAAAIVQQYGWRMSEPIGAENVSYVYPNKISADAEKGLANEEQLKLLTNLVSFLEN